jgi:hypothetical protein
MAAFGVCKKCVYETGEQSSTPCCGVQSHAANKALEFAAGRAMLQCSNLAVE